MNGTNGTNGVKSPKPVFPIEGTTREYALSLDKTDPLQTLRDEFIIPSKANLASKKLAKPGKT
jgi:kynureninase